MELHNLKATNNSRPEKHRKGRGEAAGKGKQAGKGQSGQNKRKGHRLGFEGGQTPWFRRIGKRGFNNVNHIEYQIINLHDLEKHFKDNDTVTIEKIRDLKLASKNYLNIKLLGNGTLTKKLTVQVNAVSNSAQQAIEKLGGKIEVI
ncbi:50S ribosomal protein L15 [Mycoplasma elephantis]|uniref:50S ribosomal protein L15 n=1 Tax=Mycoplasma elephantis TaxID=114882 RepID=UPI00048847FD|nr:50S ribosomal protein L15 [Mycoplasma elephantis]